MRDWLFAGLFVITVAATAVLPGQADTGFQPVQSRATFVNLVEGRELARLGIRLDVNDAGTIEGRAFGRAVTGEWDWQAGYFCRTMRFGAQEIAYNCQLVERRGETLRFTSDRGAGDSAELRLR